MENLYVLLVDTRMVGVYTSHRKATQTMIYDTIRDNLKLINYICDFDVEYFEYVNDNNEPTLWEVHEVTPDARA